MSPSILHRALNEEPHLAPDQGLMPLVPITSATSGASLPRHVTHKLIGGTSTLGMGAIIERGTGFVANILAARFAGASTFGAYSLAISTANQISTYAAGGIGATAARFSGKYPYGSRGYTTLGKALTIVSLLSALLAAISLWLGAGPIAHLLGKPSLTGLLRWAALSAAGIILLECARGFLVGQRRLAALILLSLIVGGGMLTLLPIAARMHSPTLMIVFQGLLTTSAVAICLLFRKRLRLNNRTDTSHIGDGALPLAPMLKEVWSFGAVQLIGLIGSNLAGWWLTTLVARSDTTLVQMSFFAIASQLRNLAGLAPGLLTEGSYAVMADPGGEATRTPHRVMALCSYASISATFVLASVGIVFVPWGIRLLYGPSYQGAAVTVAVGLAIAVVHMGNAPAAARLTIVSIRATGVINTIWAVFVAAAASLFLFHGGSAWQAMVIYFVGHILSSTLVMITLYQKDHVPAGMTMLFLVGTTAVAALAALAFLRGLQPTLATPLTLLMAVILACTFAALYQLGIRFRLLPSKAVLNGMILFLRTRLGWSERHV